MTIGTGWCTGPVPTNTNCTFLMCSPKTRVSTSVKSPPSLSAHFTSIFELQKGVSQQCIICTLLYHIPSYFKENDSKIQTLETGKKCQNIIAPQAKLKTFFSTLSERTLCCCCLLPKFLNEGRGLVESAFFLFFFIHFPCSYLGNMFPLSI